MNTFTDNANHSYINSVKLKIICLNFTLRPLKVPVKKIVHSYILSTKILNFCFLNVQSVLFHNLHKCTSICVYWSISRHFIACSVVQCALIYSMPVDVLYTSMFILFSSVCDNILINITQNMVTAFLNVYLHWNPCCSVTCLNLLFIIQWPTLWTLSRTLEGRQAVEVPPLGPRLWLVKLGVWLQTSREMSMCSTVARGSGTGCKYK